MVQRFSLRRQLSKMGLGSPCVLESLVEDREMKESIENMYDFADTFIS